MGRAPCCDKANVKKGPWAPEEDARLKAYIEQFGTGANWIALPQKIGLNRCGKSCRLRWLNYLRPNIKHGGFSEEEDKLICNLYISIGSRWSVIAAQLPGRTDNDIKNYWNTKLKKKLLGRHKQSRSNRLSCSSEDPKETNGVENLSSSAIERLQLHLQLQGLQNPFSFYTNLGLWPKLNPNQEKMIHQSLQLFNENSNPLMQSPQSGERQNLELYQPSNTLQQDFYSLVDESSLNEMSSPDSSIHFKSEISIPESSVNPELDGTSSQTNLGSQPVSTLQAELNDFLTSDNRMSDFDCFNEMGNSKDKTIWWSDEFDTNSASSNSWNYSPPGVGCYDVVQGYNIQR